MGSILSSADLRRAREAAILQDRESLPRSLQAFVWAAWHVLEPNRPLTWNWHHTIICEYLHAVDSGEIRRLIVNEPPRCLKTYLILVFFPAWIWTYRPSEQILALANDSDLALRDAYNARKLMQSNWYQARWGGLWQFSAGQDEKKYYSNTANGYRVSRGLDGRLTGKGGDTKLIDDPHDMKQVHSDVERTSTITGYKTAVSSRDNDPSKSKTVLVMQRGHQSDLSGELLSSGEWTLLCLPMEYDGPRYVPIRPELTDPRTKLRETDKDGNITVRGELLDPERYPLTEVLRLEREMGEYIAAGQLQQRPTTPGGGVLKSRWWKRWPKKQPLPIALKIIQSYDTAFSDDEQRRVNRGQSPSYSARTTWGMFWDDVRARHCLMLLEAWRAHYSYPDLRREVIDSANLWEPDYLLIEAKASGLGLIPDLRRAGLRSGIAIHGYNPGLDGDKMTRAALVSAQLESGQIWAPMGKKWAEMVINECSTFPNGEFSDLVDTCTQAWLFAKRLHIVAHPDDEDGRPLYSRYRNQTQKIQAAYA